MENFEFISTLALIKKSNIILRKVIVSTKNGMQEIWLAGTDDFIADQVIVINYIDSGEFIVYLYFHFSWVNMCVEHQNEIKICVIAVKD